MMRMNVTSQMHCAVLCHVLVDPHWWVSRTGNQAQPELCGQRQGGPEIGEDDNSRSYR